MIAASRGARPSPPESQTIAAIELLRQHGADINAADRNGETALHLAVGRGDEVVAYLLEHGAAADAKDRFGRTALDVAMGVPGAPARGGGPAQPPPVYERTAELLRRSTKTATP
jgi:hypothetical protein